MLILLVIVMRRRSGIHETTFERGSVCKWCSTRHAISHVRWVHRREDDALHYVFTIRVFFRHSVRTESRRNARLGFRILGSGVCVFAWFGRLFFVLEFFGCKIDFVSYTDSSLKGAAVVPHWR